MYGSGNAIIHIGYLYVIDQVLGVICSIKFFSSQSLQYLSIGRAGSSPLDSVVHPLAPISCTGWLMFHSSAALISVLVPISESLSTAAATPRLAVTRPRCFSRQSKNRVPARAASRGTPTSKPAPIPTTVTLAALTSAQASDESSFLPALLEFATLLLSTLDADAALVLLFASVLVGVVAVLKL